MHLDDIINTAKSGLGVPNYQKRSLQILWWARAKIERRRTMADKNMTKYTHDRYCVLNYSQNLISDRDFNESVNVVNRAIKVHQDAKFKERSIASKYRIRFIKRRVRNGEPNFHTEYLRDHKLDDFNFNI